MVKHLILLIFYISLLFPSLCFGKMGYIMALGDNIYRYANSVSDPQRVVFTNFMTYIKENVESAETCTTLDLSAKSIKSCYGQFESLGVTKLILIIAAHGAAVNQMGTYSLKIYDTRSEAIFNQGMATILKTIPTEIALMTCYAGSINKMWFNMPVFGASSRNGKVQSIYMFKLLQYIIDKKLTPQSSQEFFEIFNRITPKFENNNIETNFSWHKY